jgi:hypothetical protein
MNPRDERRERLRQIDPTTSDLADALEQLPAPPADPARQARLLRVVVAEIAAKNITPLPIIRPHWPIQWLVALLSAQIRVVSVGLWLASGVILGLGALVTVALHGQVQGLSAFALLSPLAAAVGMACIYGDDIDPPHEMLLTLWIGPRLVLLARMALVFGFNLLLALGFSVALWGLGITASLVALISSWLAPMLFLSALALIASVWSGHSLSAILLALIAWGGFCAAHWFEGVRLLGIPDVLGSTHWHPYLLILALILGAFSLWFAGDSEWQLGKEA